MHGLNTLAKLNADNAEAKRIVAEHAAFTYPDFHISVGDHTALVLPITPAAKKWLTDQIFRSRRWKAFYVIELYDDNGSEVLRVLKGQMLNGGFVVDQFN